MTLLFNAGGVQTYDSDLGEFISDEHVRLARVIQDYKPTLSLSYIPRERRDASDTKPWAIVERDERFGEHVIRYLTDEEMKRPNEVLAWVFAGDQDRHGREEIMRRFDLETAAAEALSMQRDLDDRADAMDKMAFFVSGGRDGKNYIRHNGETFRR